MPSVASIGECMVELHEQADGLLQRSYGGDTLNTAVYLARLGVPADYVTLLGDDPWSQEMLAGWQAEGVGTRLVGCLPGRLPGLYVIQTDATGERRFSYWRDRAPARELFDEPHAAAVSPELVAFDWLYFSGVSLSLYGEAGRAKLFDVLDQARALGRKVAFDTNFRPRGWVDRTIAQAAYGAAAARADILLASVEDLDLLFDTKQPAEFLARAGSAEIVLKQADPACVIMAEGEEQRIAAEPVQDVIDTTAAGDSFAAGYLAARLRGVSRRQAARAGHRLAGAVVRHRGAIIPKSAMPSGVLPA